MHSIECPYALMQLCTFALNIDPAQVDLPLDRGGGVKLRALWLPVASDDDVVSQDESSLVLLSLYVGKLMGAGKEGEELKLRVSTSLAVVESRLLRKMEKGWMVGEGMVVLVDKMEGKVVLEVVDMRRDKVLGEVEVDVAEESTAIVKRQWGNISEVGSCLFLPSSCSPHMFILCNLSRNTWRFVKKPFPLSLLRRNFYPKHLMG